MPDPVLPAPSDPLLRHEPAPPRSRTAEALVLLLLLVLAVLLGRAGLQQRARAQPPLRPAAVSAVDAATAALPAAALPATAVGSAAGGGSQFSSSSVSVAAECASMRRALDTDGFVVLRQFYSPAVLGPILSEIEQVVSELASKRFEDGRIPQTYSEEPLQRRMWRIYQGNENDAPKYFRRELHRHNFYRLVAYAPMVALVQCLLNTTELRLYPVYMLRGVLPRSPEQVVPWHQDSEYTFKWFAPPGTSVADMEQHTKGLINTWTALDDVDLHTSPLWVAQGSQRCGMVEHTRRKEGSKVWLELPDRKVAECGRAVPVPLRRGDVILFHALAMHRGSENSADRIRWSADLRYQDARQPTLRAGWHPGFDLAAKQRGGVDLIDTPAKWAAAPSARRFAEAASRQTVARVAKSAR
eukprot:TRINITY_DN5760_c0_g2_i1.p1 TRINITY_DN5760_c0_g2~~TRINITY_DN5760_c0_g2_i1.p1  ORF type:complete len:443 (+),score=102.14 TRINITY_DN5760_c0_g2_i1:91-1329(+)